MYWTGNVAGTDGTVVKASIDGGIIAVESLVEQPTAIFIDYLTETLYWTDDTQSNYLRASNLDGSTRRTVVDFGSLGFSFREIGRSIVIHNSILYYVGDFLGVASVNIQTMAGKFLYDSGCTIGSGIQIISEQRQQQGMTSQFALCWLYLLSMVTKQS